MPYDADAPPPPGRPAAWAWREPRPVRDVPRWEWVVCAVMVAVELVVGIAFRLWAWLLIVQTSQAVSLARYVRRRRRFGTYP